MRFEGEDDRPAPIPIVNKGHGRIEQRTLSICQTLDGIRPWVGLCTLIRVEATRHLLKEDYLMVGSVQVRYYISSLNETAPQESTSPSQLLGCGKQGALCP